MQIIDLYLEFCSDEPFMKYFMKFSWRKKYWGQKLFQSWGRIVKWNSYQVAEPEGLAHQYHSLPLDTILSQFHPLPILTTYLPKVNLYLILLRPSSSPMWPLSKRVYTQKFYTHFCSLPCVSYNYLNITVLTVGWSVYTTKFRVMKFSNPQISFLL